MSQDEALGAEQQKLSDLWDEHVRTKFGAHAADETIGTMVENPLVNQLSVLIGGNGRREVYEFYSKHFLSQIPPDMEILSVSRTIGRDSLVDEVVARFTHTISMDWLLPGIPPTGKRVEIAFVAVVKFAGNKLAHEHLYWDQAQHFNAVCVISKLGAARHSTSAKLPGRARCCLSQVCQAFEYRYSNGTSRRAAVRSLQN